MALRFVSYSLSVALVLCAGLPARAQQSPLARGLQSLNPDLSVIVDATAGFQGASPGFVAGDDPVLPPANRGRAAGYTVQEVELALSAVVDPYLKGEIYLTIPNLGGVEVEEAVATTTSLPWNLQVRAGSFRSAFGRQNGQHLHVQAFTQRPLVNAAFLGSDGLRGPGAQLSWLVPLPVFLTLSVEGFSLKSPDDPTTFASFGAYGASLAGLAHAKLFVELTDEASLSLGASAAYGRSPAFIPHFPLANFPFLPKDDTQLFGGDLYLKWKPANQAGGYFSLSFQSELLLRHIGRFFYEESQGAQHAAFDSWDGGLYAQVVAQLSRRVSLGLRFDLLGIPASAVVPKLTRYTAALTWQLSEFAKLRASAGYESNGEYGPAPDSFGGYHGSGPAPGTSAFGALAQLEISIGAHGAHAF